MLNKENTLSSTLSIEPSESGSSYLLQEVNRQEQLKKLKEDQLEDRKISETLRHKFIKRVGSIELLPEADSQEQVWRVERLDEFIAWEQQEHKEEVQKDLDFRKWWMDNGGWNLSSDNVLPTADHLVVNQERKKWPRRILDKAQALLNSRIKRDRS